MIRFFELIGLRSAPVILFSSLFVLGCGGDSGPPLGEVTGTVTRDGKPLSGAIVVFKAEGAPGASGVTGIDGGYDLRYVEQRSGAVVGENAVTIYLPPSDDSDDGDEGMEILLEESRQVKAGTQSFDFEL